jgi:FkbM family methyltransferase
MRYANLDALRAVAGLRFYLTRPQWWVENRDRNRFFRQFFHQKQLVFDIGANNGDFCQMLVDLDAKVVAVEPQPICIEQIRAKTKRNQNVFIENCAVGAEEGTIEMFVAASGSQISRLSKEWIESVKQSGRFEGHDWTQTITVRMTSLDTLIANYGIPTFCKIDVEGFEADVLAGLSHAIPTISFEYTPENAGALAKCVRKVADLGSYRFNLALHGCNAMHWPDWLTAEDLITSLDSPQEEAVYMGGDVYAQLERKYVY